MEEKDIEDPKKLLAFFLRWIDEHSDMVVAEGNHFMAYCKDEDRGDLVVDISSYRPESAKNSKPSME